MKKISFLFLFLFMFITSSASAWTVNRSWEGVNVGNKLPYTTGDNASQVNYNAPLFEVYGDDSISCSGLKSAKQTHIGLTNTETWRSAIGIAGAGAPSEGTEIWARAMLYFPSDFAWNERPKIMRLFGGGVGADYIFGGDKAFCTQGIVTNNCWWANGDKGTMISGSSGGVVDGSLFFTPGAWSSIEMYIKFSSSATEGKVRLWINGKLMYNISTKTTGAYPLPAHVGGPPLLTFFDNWEYPPSPKTQNSWIDEVVITTDSSIPTKIDSLGNRMIGPASCGSPPPPPPPPVSSLIFSESWVNSNTSSGLVARGWTDSTSSVGKGFRFEFDYTLNKNVMYIFWNKSYPSSDPKQPYGNTDSLQHFLPSGSCYNGCTMYLTFKSKNFYNRTSGDAAHYVRLLQNWLQNWGGMGSSPNQINLEVGGAGGNSYPVKAFWTTGGSYASYFSPQPRVTGYLQDGYWYEVRLFVKPQSVKGQCVGLLRGDYRKLGITAWTTFVNLSNVCVTDTSGMINKVVIGPYHLPSTSDDRLYIGEIRVYNGDAITDGTLK